MSDDDRRRKQANQLLKRRPTIVIDSSHDQEPAGTHESANIKVTSQLTLGPAPSLNLAWEIDKAKWRDGYKLLVFHSTTGFSPDEYPEDLTRHGSLIIEKQHNAESNERLAEGMHFYTFVLTRRQWLGLTRSVEILRFSVTVPSAKVAIDRIQDQKTLVNMAQEEVLGPMRFHTQIYKTQAERIEARRKLKNLKHPPAPSADNPKSKVMEKTMSKIDLIIEAFLAKGKKIEEVKNDPRFAQLSKDERTQLFERINEILDPSEVIARCEQSE